jgi:hypothetical protein
MLTGHPSLWKAVAKKTPRRGPGFPREKEIHGSVAKNKAPGPRGRGLKTQVPGALADQRDRKDAGSVGALEALFNAG